MPDQNEISVDAKRVQSIRVAIKQQSNSIDSRFHGLETMTSKFKGMFSEYAFNTAKRHSDFRAAYKNGDETEIKKAFDAHNAYSKARVRHDLKIVLEELCKILNVNGTTAQKVRACIKRPQRASKDDPTVLIREYGRSREVDYSEPCPIDENTGFLEVSNTARPFVCDDLMKLVYSAIDNNEAYKNPRILSDATNPIAKAFKLAYESRYNWSGEALAKISSSRSKELLKAWLDLWRAQSNGKFQEQHCYASTCIYPITLADTNTSDAFKEEFYVNVPQNHVFAFLCIDHPDPHFFDSTAKTITQIVANLVVSYFIRDYAYTHRSREWKDCWSKYH